ncbi:hypothetical protein BD408DRAFT_394908 [Parasitella parasitica]|nr:hypothetical protein BD408DRAFT_394908 [Parasitella parasitica]
MTVASVAAAIVGIPALLVAMAHINSLPFSYTIRSWWLLRALVARAEKLELKPEYLFAIVSQSQRCMWDDIDYNQHMNNSTYNKNLDFCRIHLLYVVLPKIMMEPDHNIFAHNAGVFTLFKKEIPPLQPYTIETRIWTWNEKWLFLQHRFVITGGNTVQVCCIATSKIVFKLTSGKTVSPAEIFQICGHFDTIHDQVIEARRRKSWESAKYLLTMQHDWSNDGRNAKEAKL